MGQIIKPTLEGRLRFGRREFIGRMGSAAAALNFPSDLWGYSANQRGIFCPLEDQAQEVAFSNPRPHIDEIVSSGTRNLTIFVDTNVNADLRWEHAGSDIPYEEMRYPFTNTGGTRHSTEIPGLSDGNQYFVFVKARNKATGVVTDLDFLMPFTVSNDKVAVELDQSVTEIFSGRGAGHGSLSFPSLGNLQIPLVNSIISVSKRDGLFPGQYVALLKSDAGLDRYMFLDVTPTEMSVNLGGGRRETKLNVIGKNSLDFEDFVRHSLRGRGILGRPDQPLHRIEAPLKIGLLDEWEYSIAGGTYNLIREGRATVNSTGRANLYSILRNNNRRSDLAFFSNGLYPIGDLLNKYFFVQSMGHSIPENERSTGWLLIYAMQGPGVIWRTDSSNNTRDKPNITWASMAFKPRIAIHEEGWLGDIQQCLGWAEIGDNLGQTPRQSDTTRKYALLMFSRPAGWKLPDTAISYNPSRN